MKKRIVSLSVVLVLVLSVFLCAAVLASADSDDPNTPASSTMIFQGDLTYEGGGVFSGTIPMVSEVTLGIGDSEDGFDIYAKTGAKATYDTTSSGESYVCGVIQEHDAYTTAGGWGTFYDPDCADYEHYQIKFADGTWALEYVSEGTAHAAPMSGTMDWNAKYARETGAGEYYTSPATTAENYGYALNNDCTGHGKTGEGAWDMDWSWGSEYIPLQYPGFSVSVSAVGDDYRVTMIPAAAGATKLTVEVPDIVAISVDPTSIDYGQLLPGQNSDQKNVVVTNIGTNKVKVDVSVDPSGTVFDNLYLYKGGWQNPGPWDDFITGLVMSASSTVITQLRVPSSHTPAGDEDATLLFEAEKDIT
jgi:hypothetical protein